jgi:hypothetical protein
MEPLPNVTTTAAETGIAPVGNLTEQLRPLVVAAFLSSHKQISRIQYDTFICSLQRKDYPQALVSKSGSESPSSFCKANT